MTDLAPGRDGHGQTKDPYQDPGTAGTTREKPEAFTMFALRCTLTRERLEVVEKKTVESFDKGLRQGFCPSESGPLFHPVHGTVHIQKTRRTKRRKRGPRPPWVHGMKRVVAIHGRGLRSRVCVTVYTYVTNNPSCPAAHCLRNVRRQSCCIVSVMVMAMVSRLPRRPACLQHTTNLVELTDVCKPTSQPA